MAGYYMKEMTVPIPNDRRVVIRREKTVEYEIDRIHSEEKGDTRVTRRVIGKMDPVNPGRMFPNEMYFQLFPENEVPEEVRDEFLRGCEIKRQMREVRIDPDRIIEGVVNGMSELGAFRSPPNPFGPRAFLPRAAARSPLKSSTPARFPGVSNPSGSFGSEPDEKEDNSKSLNYIMLRRLFDDVYYSVEELAGKYPNEVMDPFKVKRINEILGEIREWPEDEKILPYLRLIDEPKEATDKEGKVFWEGLTYSDVLMMLKWYKVLPR